MKAPNRKEGLKLLLLAAHCGIDARGLTPEQVRYAHNVKRDPKFADQHDMRLDEFLRSLDSTKPSITFKKGDRVKVTITNPTDKHLNGTVGVVSCIKGEFVHVRMPGFSRLFRCFPDELTAT